MTTPIKCPDCGMPDETGGVDHLSNCATFARGTFMCPICGVDTPHAHDRKTVDEYRNWEIEYNKRRMEKAEELARVQAERRARRQAEVSAKREAEIQRLIAQRTANPCDYCRDLPHGNQELKYGCGEFWGLIETHGEANEGFVHCPVCKHCLCEWY